jgi:molecular chaperone IbpA
MRTFDFAPLYQSSIGFDRLFDLLNGNSAFEEQSDYPPYDIVRSGEDRYCITLALAGFAPGDISITAQRNLLTITGQKSEPTNQEYLYRGIPVRSFEKRFDLEDHVEVEGASFEQGLLRIDLIRNIPQAMKARRIEIGSGKKAGKLDNGKSAQRASS